jgi:hypothetical protein
VLATVATATTAAMATVMERIALITTDMSGQSATTR